MSNKNNVTFLPSQPFKTQFNSHSRVYQEPGNGDRVLYNSIVQDDGSVELVESGRENLYESIQSHKDSCDIHVLLARFHAGDPEALSRVQGVYGDFTEMPKSYAELLNAVIAGNNMFMSLPVEVREKFDHSPEKFMAAMDDMPSFLEKIGYQAPKPDSPDPVPPAPAPTEDKGGEAA